MNEILNITDNDPNPLQTKNLDIMSIEQSNIFLALFQCNGKTSNYFNGETGYIGAGPSSVPPTTKDLNYHKSPEWLEPIINRIESGDYTITVSKEGCIIKSDDYDFYPDTDESFYEEHEGNRHNATFTAVLAFLKWAKENKIII